MNLYCLKWAQPPLVWSMNLLLSEVGSTSTGVVNELVLSEVGATSTGVVNELVQFEVGATFHWCAQ
ncbi:hypothetical protein DPMN_147080 [Dreissena polymorpha]|uniref:Uncharacterized protein n=1 Tax=Dreissena polymorpha TaxID=45954 RepID=A0A9D4IZ03_DREPO|nr:hypothetical protein DPMN_147080 [Dreissena polymorpha]